MSVPAVSSAMPTYQVPVSAQAKTDDERTESAATKAKEADTGKEAAARVRGTSSQVDIKV